MSKKELLDACRMVRDLLRHYRDGKEGAVYMVVRKAIQNEEQEEIKAQA